MVLLKSLFLSFNLFLNLLFEKTTLLFFLFLFFLFYRRFYFLNWYWIPNLLGERRIVYAIRLPQWNIDETKQDDESINLDVVENSHGGQSELVRVNYWAISAVFSSINLILLYRDVGTGNSFFE